MMLGYRFIFISILFSFSFNFWFESKFDNVENYYQSGLELYQSKEYKEAKLLLEKILDNNWESPQLYYNLGNIYYRLNSISEAIWAYEMSLLRDPNHHDALFNLKLVNVNVKDRIDIPSPPIYLVLYLSIKEKFTTSEWIKINLWFLILIAFFLLLQKFQISSKVIKLFTNLVLVISFISFTFLFHSFWNNTHISKGIISDKVVNILSEPNLDSTILFKLHEGLKVSINNSSSDWVEIELIDGKSGWIPAKQIKIIK